MTQNATITQGDDVVLRFTVYDDDTQTTPLNITGYTGIYRAAYRDDTVLEKTNGVVQDGPNGIFEVTLTETETAALRAAVHRHQLQMTDTSTNEHTVTNGSLTVRKRLPVV